MSALQALSTRLSTSPYATSLCGLELLVYSGLALQVAALFGTLKPHAGVGHADSRGGCLGLKLLVSGLKLLVSLVSYSPL